MAGIDPISIGLSAIQTGVGLYQTISGSSKMNDLQKQRKAYQTPEEVDKILNLALSNAGGDTQTRDFQTNQLDRTFSGVLGVAERLGADPNNLSSLLDQKISGIMKIAESTHASRMEAMGKVFNALNLVADNKAAEQKSQDDILKDKIAAQAAKVQAGYQNLSGGMNTALATIEADKASKLYTPPQTTV